MSTELRSLSIAIVQRAAHYLDLEASLELAIHITNECADHGATLVVFGECWLTGYPAWIDHAKDYTRWNNSEAKEIFRAMYLNGVQIDGPEIAELSNVCAKRNVAMCMGINETDSARTGTIYNSVIVINNTGAVVLHHQKLMPTYTEKLLYGLGDGRGLEAANLSLAKGWGTYLLGTLDASCATGITQ